jgi:hypothetical protein
MPANKASDGALYAIKPEKTALYTKYFVKIAVQSLKKLLTLPAIFSKLMKVYHVSFFLTSGKDIESEEVFSRRSRSI